MRNENSCESDRFITTTKSVKDNIKWVKDNLLAWRQLGLQGKREQCNRLEEPVDAMGRCGGRSDLSDRSATFRVSRTVGEIPNRKDRCQEKRSTRPQSKSDRHLVTSSCPSLQRSILKKKRPIVPQQDCCSKESDKCDRIGDGPFRPRRLHQRWDRPDSLSDWNGHNRPTGMDWWSSECALLFPPENDDD